MDTGMYVQIRIREFLCTGIDPFVLIVPTKGQRIVITDSMITTLKENL